MPPQQRNLVEPRIKLLPLNPKPQTELPESICERLEVFAGEVEMLRRKLEISGAEAVSLEVEKT